MTKNVDKKAREIGRRIAEARKEAGGMAQRELGELLGVSERSIAAYESGEVIPYRFLKDLERVLGVSGAWLLHGEEATVVRDEQLDEIFELLKQLKKDVLALQS